MITVIIVIASFFAGMAFAAWMGRIGDAKEGRRSVATNPWE